jgi:hypothetical protein
LRCNYLFSRILLLTGFLQFPYKKGGMEDVPSLQSIMNSMASRLDDILPEPLQARPADRDWPFIHLYLGSDPLLAQLYKQYCDARAKLAALHKEFGRGDAMAAIASDMKDSAHTAVETRLLEIKDSKVVQGQVAARIEAQQKIQKIEKPEEAFDRIIAMMIWAKFVIKTGRLPLPAVKRQFSLAA